MTRLRSSAPVASTLAAVIALCLSSCALKEGPSDTPQPTSTDGEIHASPTASPTVDASRVGTLVTVEETEWDITVLRDDFEPGVYTFEIVNDGIAAHNLHVTGPGIEDAASNNMASRRSTTLTVTLEDGEYILYCASGDHRSKGMEAIIYVGTAKPSPSASPSA